ncbi:MAG TPA: succinate dehydrogenase, hydrophobic membrane anchor protein [Burkholderiales bacterium]|nr:succinate dehydrogenase, hydrophobic membrane anchor protein [Burkholderiales bacterium]
MVKRIVLGAHHGLRDWLVQRVSAVVMVVYTLIVLCVLLVQPSLQYAEWKALFSDQWMRLASLLFLLSMFIHAWIGVHDVLMDYIQPTGVRLLLQAPVILALIGYAAWSIQILWSV